MRVERIENGDEAAFRWGTSGTPFVFKAGDEVAGLAAYKKAVTIGLAAGYCGEMSDVERAVARDVSRHVGIRKDAGDAVIVAWYPDPETAAAIKAIHPSGSEAVEDLHMTLLFLGDPDADNTEWDMDLLAAALKLWSTRCSKETVKIAGCGRFVSEGDTDAIIALVDGTGLPQMRTSLIEALSYACAIPFGSQVYNPQHGFIPHITLDYVPKGTGNMPMISEPAEVEIGSIRLAAGPSRTSDFPLGYVYADEEAKMQDPTSFYMSRNVTELDAMRKAGRVISGSNMKKLDTIISHATEIRQSEIARRESEEDVGKANEDIEGELDYVVAKASDEWQFTLGPLYSPDRKDAHGEWTDADNLQKALHAFVQDRFDAGNNRLNLQHGDTGDMTVGNMVEFMSLPFEHVVKMTTADGEVVDHTFPAGTVWIGAKWDNDAWPLVKSGKIGGFSMGGKAVRMLGGEGLDHMGYKHAARGTDVEKAAHPYLPGAGGMCKICKKTKADGDHTVTKAEVADDVQAMQDERERAALAVAYAAGERDERREGSSLLGKALELFAKKPVGDTHVHLPEQNVTINEAPVPVEIVEDG